MLRDSQNYVYAAGEGLGIFELPAYRIEKDIEQLNLIIEWLDMWRMRHLDAASTTEFEHRPGAQVLTPSHQRDRD